MGKKYVADKRKNPFIHRWKLDDQNWIKKRKKNWPYIEANLKCELKGNKELKHFKAFYVNGVEPPDRIGFDASHRLAYTPCESEEEVWEVFNNGPPSEYERMLHLGAWGGVTDTNNPFGYAGGQEILIAKTLYNKTYSESYEYYQGKKIAKFISSAEYVDRFIMSSCRYLAGDIERYYITLPYNLNYFISCIKHLEKIQKPFNLHPWLPNLLSLAYNFVEPRAPLGKTSEAARFARQIVDRLKQDDIPICLENAIEKLGSNRLLEYSVDETPGHEVVFVQNLYGPWSAPYPRVVHGLSAKTALAVLLSSARRVKLVSNDYSLPGAQAINLGSLLSKQFSESLGYESDETVPGYRYTIWFSPQQSFSNNPDAKFGVDLLIPILSNEKRIEKNTPVLIYYPRLSEHYRYWYTTEILLLLERQLRRDVFLYFGSFLIEYDEASNNNPNKVLPDYFNEHFRLEPGYDVLKDYKSGTMELALDGPDVEDWTGDTLPPAPTEGKPIIRKHNIKPVPYVQSKSSGSPPDEGYIDLTAIMKLDANVSLQTVMGLLSVDTRPDFDDDLNENDKALFAVIDGLPFPDQLIALNEQQIFVHWKYLEEDLDEFDFSLQQVGTTIQKAQVFLDDPGIDPEQDGLYYLREQPYGLISIDPKERNLKMPENFQDKKDLPTQLQALLQEF